MSWVRHAYVLTVAAGLLLPHPGVRDIQLNWLITLPDTLPDVDA